MMRWKMASMVVLFVLMVAVGPWVVWASAIAALQGLLLRDVTHR